MVRDSYLNLNGPWSYAITALKAVIETGPYSAAQALQRKLAERQKLMEKGNLLLGCQEQMGILQKSTVFGDKDVQEALGAVVITDKRIEGPEHKKFVAAEIDKWGAVIKAAGTYAD